MAVGYKIPRGTRAALLTKASAAAIVAGQLYLLTDEDRVAVGVGTSTFVDLAKLSEVTGAPFIPLSAKGAINGVPELDSNGTVPGNQLPNSSWSLMSTGTGLSQNIGLPESGLPEEAVLVYVNGLRWPSDEYTIVGSTLTITTNAAGDDIEIVKAGIGSSTASSAAGSWGQIAGTLSSQTDLQAALDAKASVTALNAKADVTALNAKADVTALNAKADQSAVDLKADISALNAKADQSAVDLKAPKADPTFTGIVAAAAITATGNITSLGNVTAANVIRGFKFGVSGKTLASEKYPTTAEYAFTATTAASSAKAGTAATASTVFTIKKNGATTVGTFTFAAAATTATVSITAGALVAGDFVTIEAPATPDATLADIAFTVRA